MQLRGDETIYAGTAPANNFLTPAGEPVFAIPMGKSSKEAYRNIINAFNNKQTRTYAELGKEDVEITRDTTVKKTKEKRK